MAGIGLALGLVLVPVIVRPRAATPGIRPDLDSDRHVLIFRGNKASRGAPDDPAAVGIQAPRVARLDLRSRPHLEPSPPQKLDPRDPWTNEEPESVVTTSGVARTVLDHRDPWSPDTEYPPQFPTTTPLDQVDPWSGGITSRGGDVVAHTLAD